jgi:hypothetical protein
MSDHISEKSWRSSITYVGVCSAAILISIADLAKACEEPGTPNQEKAIAISPTAVRLRWNNTASEGNVYFDIEGQTDPSIANFGPYSRYRDHPQQIEREITGLSTGRQHCFRMWARVGANGCRSKLPSAWACATPLTTSADPDAVGGAHGPQGGVRGTPAPPPKVIHLPSGPVPSLCAAVGQACTSNPSTCCNDARSKGFTSALTPELCVYETCRECVPHGQECRAGGSQLCCDVNDNCKLDQSSEKTICDIVDGPKGPIKVPLRVPANRDICKSGFVWREASSADHVCVQPVRRDQVSEENRNAEREACKLGHVWREAFAGDHVCVTPQSRSAAAEDNAQSATRRAQ